MDAALDRVCRCAVKRYDTEKPTFAQLNTALAEAVESATNADKNGDDSLPAASASP